MSIIPLPVKSQTCREAGAENRGSLQGRTDSRVAWKGNSVLFCLQQRQRQSKTGTKPQLFMEEQIARLAGQSHVI